MHRRILVGLVGLCLGALPARADGEHDGNTIVGIGLGPAPSLGGELTPAFEGDGASMRMRLGMRARQIGAELAVTVGAVADLRTETGEYASRDGAVTALTPTFTFYPAPNPPVQMMVRAGLGYAVLEGFTKRMAVPCTIAEECVTRDEIVDVGYRGYVLDLGLTAQVHLARRTARHRAVLWIDAGLALTRMQVDDEVLSGSALQLTIGIAHAFVD